MDLKEWADNHLEVVSVEGVEANCLCPFHEDHRPSFRFNTKSGLWFCHGCGEKGNLSILATRLDAEAPVVTVEAMLADVDDFVQGYDQIDGMRETIPESGFNITWLNRFTSDPQSHDYWVDERGLPLSAVDDWELGFDSATDAGTIPLRDEATVLLGVIRRFKNPGYGGKYLYPKGFKKSEFLFGAHELDNRFVTVTEGSLDAIACSVAGIPAVAMLGSHFSPDQGQLLARLGISTVIAMPDNDAAGKMALRDIEVNLPAGVQMYVAEYPPGVKAKDPLEVLTRDSGKRLLRIMVENAVPIFAWDGKWGV